MKRGLGWKLVVIIVVILGSIVYSYPISKKINLGLDLQGGMYLVLEVEVEKAIEGTVEQMVDVIKNSLDEKGIDFERVYRDSENNIIITTFDSDAVSMVKDLMKDYYTLEKRQEDTGKREIIYSLSAKEINTIKENAAEQAMESIRNRVDQFGVAEPSIQREGKNRLIIQLPGIKEPERAIKLIGKTALLEFKLVDEENRLEDALNGNLPEGSEILYEKEINPETGEVISKKPFLLKKRTVLTGNSLVSAEVRIDNQFNEPYISIRFNKAGTKIFAQVTKENVKRRLAIVLDNNVYSAPVIQEEITGGQAQITGRFTPEDAHDLAIILKAGALPAPVHILENRTVGPSLGRDSIKQGIISSLSGSLVVIIFMVIYYKLSGINAALTLILNLIILVGALAAFNATLTLPGIAGVVLSIGMAVDANILIFERIKEEQRIGKTPKVSIDNGFSKAFLTILDSNVTTIITGIVLFQFGTGPIKGFAITLCIGLIANMFTAIFISKVIFDWIYGRRQVTKISI